ncbi:MAG: prepilin-type N-terminal cleavage/methylation domain-containing protein [Gemmatimonadaceae bacterium]|nr:prepilin-type N-terminal cleavage/methylation domain-containing protein [Gemmatimonadaceae bacterium]
MQSHRSRNALGFSLLELLIVIVLVGIVMAISIRSVGETIRRDRVNKIAAMLSADLEQAFAIAARQRTPVRLLFDTTYARRTFSVADFSDTTFKYRSRTFKDGDLQLDYIRSSSLSLDVMPSGLSADTLSIRVGIISKNMPYDRTLRMTRAGMVRIK